jgi:hypothetical protein
MASNQDKDDSIGGLTKAFLRPYGSIALAFALPYVITAVLFAAFVAYVFPKAFAIVATVLVVIFVVILRKVLRTRRRIQHSLIARRADKQNTAFIRGKVRAEEVMRSKPGKYRREDLDRLFGTDRGVYGKYRPEDLD